MANLRDLIAKTTGSSRTHGALTGVRMVSSDSVLIRTQVETLKELVK
jgi:hypothetical protein